MAAPNDPEAVLPAEKVRHIVAVKRLAHARQTHIDGEADA